MHTVAIVARWETLVILVTCAGVTIWKVLASASFSGLLRSHDGTFSAGRAQMLVLTVGTALQYLLAVIHNPSKLPAISSGMLLALSGSQGIYLGTKAWSLFWPPKNNREES
jgi:hypothetical protein